VDGVVGGKSPKNVWVVAAGTRLSRGTISEFCVKMFGYQKFLENCPEKPFHF
jgi:hypothetical protein